MENLKNYKTADHFLTLTEETYCRKEIYIISNFDLIVDSDRRIEHNLRKSMIPSLYSLSALYYVSIPSENYAAGINKVLQTRSLFPQVQTVSLQSSANTVWRYVMFSRVWDIVKVAALSSN